MFHSSAFLFYHTECVYKVECFIKSTLGIRIKIIQMLFKSFYVLTSLSLKLAVTFLKYVLNSQLAWLCRVVVVVTWSHQVTPCVGGPVQQVKKRQNTEVQNTNRYAPNGLRKSTPFSQTKGRQNACLCVVSVTVIALWALYMQCTRCSLSALSVLYVPPNIVAFGILIILLL